MINFSKCTDLGEFNEQINILLQFDKEQLSAQTNQISQFIQINETFIHSSATVENLSDKLLKLEAKISDNQNEQTKVAIAKIQAVIRNVFSKPSAPPMVEPMNESSRSSSRPDPIATSLDSFSQDEPSIAYAIPDPLLTKEEWQTRFQTQVPNWYESKKTYSIANRTFYNLGYTLAGATLFAAGWYIAVPATVVLTTAGLGSSSALSFLAASYLKPKGKDFYNDPEFLIKAGQEAEENIVQNNLSFRQIKDQYSDLMQHGLLTDQDLNRLFRNQILDNTNSYPDLQQLLGKNPPFSQFEWGFKFDPDNQAWLRKKALSPEFREKEKISSSEMASLGISPHEIAKIIAQINFERLLNNEINYTQFENNVSNKWGFFDQSQLNRIRPLAISYYAKNHHGLQSWTNPVTNQGLTIGIEDLIQAGALTQDIAKLQHKNMSYHEFKKKHSRKVIFLHQAAKEGSPDEKESVKNALLFSYQEMKTYALSDLEIFSIKWDENIGGIIQKAVSEEEKTLNSFKDQEIEFNKEFQQKKETYNKEFLDTKNRHLKEVQDDLRNKKRDLDNLRQKEKSLNSKIRKFEDEKQKHFNNLKKLKAAENELIESVRKEQQNGTFNAVQKQNLICREKEVEKNLKRKKEVKERLEEIEKIPQLERQIEDLHKNIEKNKEKIKNISSKPVQGFVNATAALWKERRLQSDISNETQKIKNLNQKLQKGQKDRLCQSSLQDEMRSFGNLESERQVIKKEIEEEEKKEGIAHKKEALNREIRSLTACIHSFEQQQGLNLNMELSDKLALKESEKESLILETETKNLENSELKIRTAMEVTLQDQIKDAQVILLQKMKEVKKEKELALCEIQKMYVDEINQAVLYATIP